MEEEGFSDNQSHIFQVMYPLRRQAVLLPRDARLVIMPLIHNELSQLFVRLDGDVAMPVDRFVVFEF